MGGWDLRPLSQSFLGLSSQQSWQDFHPRSLLAHPVKTAEATLTGERVREASHPGYSCSPLRPPPGMRGTPRPPTPWQRGPRASGVRPRAGTFHIQLGDFLRAGGYFWTRGVRRAAKDLPGKRLSSRLPAHPTRPDWLREKGHKWGGKRAGTFPKPRRSARGGLRPVGGDGPAV